MNDQSWTREGLLDHYKRIRERVNPYPIAAAPSDKIVSRMVVPDQQTLRAMSIKVEEVPKIKKEATSSKPQPMRPMIRDVMVVASLPVIPIAKLIEIKGFESLSVREIVAFCSIHYNVSFMDVLSSRRDMKPTFARQVACWIAKTYTTKSLPMIGRPIGGRDHTTVMHAVRKIQKLVDGGKFHPPEFDMDKAILARRIVGTNVYLPDVCTGLIAGETNQRPEMV